MSNAQKRIRDAQPMRAQNLREVQQIRMAANEKVRPEVREEDLPPTSDRLLPEDEDEFETED